MLFIIAERTSSWSFRRSSFFSWAIIPLAAIVDPMEITKADAQTSGRRATETSGRARNIIKIIGMVKSRVRRSRSIIIANGMER